MEFVLVAAIVLSSFQAGIAGRKRARYPGRKPLIPLRQLRAQYAALEPSSSPEQYQALIGRLREPDGLQAVFKAHIAKKRADAIKALQDEWGLSRDELNQIKVMVERARDTQRFQPATYSVQAKKEAVPGELLDRIRDSFLRNGCGHLVIEYEPGGASLMRIEDTARKRQEARSGVGYESTQHTITFNDDFLCISTAAQNGLIHHMIAKIVYGHALWSRVLGDTIQSKHPFTAQEHILTSNSVGQYRDYLAAEADAAVAGISMVDASEINALYGVYQKHYEQYRELRKNNPGLVSYSPFMELYPQRRDAAICMHRCMKLMGRP